MHIGTHHGKPRHARKKKMSTKGKLLCARTAGQSVNGAFAHQDNDACSSASSPTRGRGISIANYSLSSSCSHRNTRCCCSNAGKLPPCPRQPHWLECTVVPHLTNPQAWRQQRTRVNLSQK